MILVNARRIKAVLGRKTDITIVDGNSSPEVMAKLARGRLRQKQDLLH